METVAFCEIEKYPQSILKKHWPDVPIFKDIRKLNKEVLNDAGIKSIDVICGGFPCQDLSIAGKQKGIEAERSGLWSEYKRLIGEIRPRYAIMENVTNLLSGGGGQWFGRLLRDLAEVGYDAEWHCIPASYIGACHTRDRVWIVAYPYSFMLERGAQKPIFRQQHLQIEPSGRFEKFRTRSDLPSSRFCSHDDGVSERASKLKALGNAVVPQIPELIGRAIMQIDERD